VRRTLVVVACLAALLALCAAPVMAQAKTWKKVSSLAGATTREGGYFKLVGGQQKVTWKLIADSEESAELVTAAIYVMKKGTTLDEDGGFPVAWPDEVGSGSTKTHLGRGTYYFHVASANCSWRVTLYEWR
jgi:hypothetical protein